jgi:outer membrane protein TolC
MTRDAVLLLLALPLATSLAQSVTRRDTLRLRDAHDAAARTDPRGHQLALERQASALRQQSIAAERRPSIIGDGTAQYQSAVTTIPSPVPNVTFVEPPNDTYDAHLQVQQHLFDPSLGARSGAERANLAVAEARIRTSLYSLRAEVDDAFFSAALAQARAAELTTVISDLEAQLRVAAARVREGTALPSEAATIEAELLRRRQDQRDLASTRHASLAVLATLTGRTIDERDTLALPDLAADVAAARDALPHARPEYAQFARAREQLAAQERVVAAGTRPRVSAYGRAGYGKPGLNILAQGFNSYWLAGVEVQWAPWTWGTNDREREVLALQQQIVTSDEAAFTAGTQRAIDHQVADIDRLTASLATDDAIIVLRERIARETQHRYNEAVVTAAEYVDRRNDVLAARLARAGHDVELARARARFLTTVGVEIH